MLAQIAIRGVAEEVRDELALQAAERRQSMQNFRRAERIVSRPSLDSWHRDVRRRKDAAGSCVQTSDMLRARDADRR